MFLSAFYFYVCMVNQKHQQHCSVCDVIEEHFNIIHNIFASKFGQHNKVIKNLTHTVMWST